MMNRHPTLTQAISVKLAPDTGTIYRDRSATHPNYAMAHSTAASLPLVPAKPAANDDATRLDTFEASRRRLFALAYRMLANRADAEDVVQDTFIRWHTADIDTLQVPAAWLTTVATRLSIDRLRRAGEQRLLGLGEHDFATVDGHPLEATEPSPEALALAKSELTQAMHRMLERLSRDEFTALILREGFDADYAAIAGLIERTPEHCRQILHRAKTRLHQGPPRGIADVERREALVQPLLDAVAVQDVEWLMMLAAVDDGWLRVAGTAPSASSSGVAIAAQDQVGALLATAMLMVRLRHPRGWIECASRSKETSAVFG